MLKTFLLFVTVTITSLYQSPVKCRSRKVEETSSKVSATTVIFQAWNLCSYLKEWTVCLLNNEEKAERSKESTSCNIILESMHDNVVNPRETSLCMLY